MGKTGHQHPLKLGFILRSHHREIGHRSQVTDVVLPLMRRTIGSDDAGTIEHERHGKFLNAHVVDQLVVSPLQEGAVDRHHRAQPLTGHPGGERHRMLLGDTDIDVLLRNSLLQQIKTGSRRHGGGDADHPAVLFAQLHQRLPEHLAVTGRLRLFGGNGLAGAQVESRLGVVAHLISLGVGIALAFGGDHMHQNRPLRAMGRLEGPDHLSDVVAIDRPHVSETEFLEHRSNLRHRQSAHAPLEAIEFRRQFATHEGQMTDAFLDAAGEKLHRWTQPGPVERVGESSHRW